jgi:phosphoserine aminotransferase
VPKIFRLTKDGKLNKEIFEGATINTPSMLCVEDYLDTLAWAESIGGLEELIARSDRNAKAVTDWVERTKWVDFLAVEAATRSNTSVCLRVVDSEISSRSHEEQAAFAGRMVKLLEKEGVAFDIGAYRDAPPGLRLWCGATVETSDLEALLPWLNWAFATLRKELAASTQAA